MRRLICPINRRTHSDNPRLWHSKRNDLRYGMQRGQQQRDGLLIKFSAFIRPADVSYDLAVLKGACMSIAEILLPEFDTEFADTRKFLALIPNDKLTWKPDESSMELG